jgi:FkbM family methyltransferase
MSLFVNIYARLIYSIFAFLITRVYHRQQPKTMPFSAEKHTKMARLSLHAFELFNLLTMVVSKKTKHNYTLTIEYKDNRLLIRPFSDLLEIIMVTDAFEPYVKAILDKDVKSGDVIADVGANLGIYVIVLGKKASKVIAFEPHPKSFEMLEKNVELNQLNNVILIKKPVSDSKKKVLLDLSCASIVSEIASSDVLEKVTDNNSLETESIDLDTALAMESKLDWLLIDVEGSEVNVLNGAEMIIKKFAPKIIIEVRVNCLDEVSAILTSKGYSMRLLYGHTLHEDNNVSYYYASM